MKKDKQFDKWFLERFGALPLTERARYVHIKKANRLAREASVSTQAISQDDFIKKMYNACLYTKQAASSKKPFSTKKD